MKTKLSFFSPSVVNNIKDGKGGETFTDYIFSILCCRIKKLKYYEIQLKAIRKIISIHTYTNLIIKASNEDEFEIYDSMRAEKK